MNLQKEIKKSYPKLQFQLYLDKSSTGDVVMIKYLGNKVNNSLSEASLERFVRGKTNAPHVFIEKWIEWSKVPDCAFTNALSRSLLLEA